MGPRAQSSVGAVREAGGHGRTVELIACSERRMGAPNQRALAVSCAKLVIKVISIDVR
jgi:hypothetical protein